MIRTELILTAVLLSIIAILIKTFSGWQRTEASRRFLLCVESMTRIRHELSLLQMTSGYFPKNLKMTQVCPSSGQPYEYIINERTGGYTLICRQHPEFVPELQFTGDIPSRSISTKKCNEKHTDYVYQSRIRFFPW